MTPPPSRLSLLLAEFPTRFFLVLLVAVTATHWLAVDVRQMYQDSFPWLKNHSWVLLMIFAGLFAIVYGCLAKLHHQHRHVLGLFILCVLLTHWVAMEAHETKHHLIEKLPLWLSATVAALVAAWASYRLHELEEHHQGVHQLDCERAGAPPPQPVTAAAVPRPEIELQRHVVAKKGASAKALIAFVSTPNFEIKFGEAAAPDLPPEKHAWITRELPTDARRGLPPRRMEAALTGDLETDLINPELKQVQCNWQQLMRAIRPHAAAEFVSLIGSPESGPHLEHCKRFLAPYLPQAKIVFETDARQWINFENFEGLHDHLETLLSSEPLRRFSADEIVVDVTGGMKTASIAGAAVTLKRSTRFQYVPTQGKQEDDFLPWIYDVRLKTPFVPG